ncbi:MAG: phosphogluconate dehydrogenase C-terminal domain-containing protein [Halobacteriales archaeon]
MNLALLGAGGTMGSRIAANLARTDRYDVAHVEPDPDGRDRLRERGVEPIDRADALAGADIVVLAVPDRIIGDLCGEIAGDLVDGTIVLTLDPAAALAGDLPDREGLVHVVSHPCHPTLFGNRSPEHAEDWFGGQGAAEQPVTCALHAGPEGRYAEGEAVVRDVWAPVSRVHRVSVEEMALLEVALAENLLATFLLAVREGLEELVARGLDRGAAEDFLLGHARAQLAMFFGPLDHGLSEAAERAVEQGREQALAEDWAAVLGTDRLRENVREILA